MSLTDEQKEQIYSFLRDAGSQYIPVQELTAMASKIVNDPTEETLQEVQDYLAQFPYYRLGQTQMHPTTQQAALAGNDIRLGISEIRKIIEAASAAE